MSDKPIRPEVMKRIEANARKLGHVIGGSINALGQAKETGFALVIFSYEGSELTYVSSAEREDMIKALTELLLHLRAEGGDAGTAH